MTRWPFLVREGMAALGRSRRSAGVAVIMTAVAIFSAGLFQALASGFSRLAAGWARDAAIVVYFLPGVGETSAEADAAARMLEESGLVREVRRVSAAEARTRLATLYGGLAGSIESVDPQLLPASLEAALGDDPGQGRRERLIAELAGSPGIEEVQYDRDWVERLAAIARGVRWLGGAVLLLLGTGAALTASGAMRFSLIGARDEIRVLRLVGADELVIRGPYVVAGAFVGLTGAALACTALVLFLSASDRLLRSLLPIFPSGLLTRPSVGELALLALIGLVATTSGSLLAARHTGKVE